MTHQAPRKCGRYRSLVRMLSSILPLRPAPRIFFNIVRNPINVYDFQSASQSSEKVAGSSSQQIIFRKSESSPSQFNAKPDLLEFGPIVENSDLSDCNEEKGDGLVTKKIDNLERELQELREQMARIVAAQLQSEKRQLDAPRPPAFAPALASSTPTAPAPPPPPPPPPPPLPPMCNPPSMRLTITKRQADKDNSNATPKRSSGMRMPFDMTDVLKDLGKVKLRQIARSPGGTPLRQAPPPTDPNTVLMQVLKKRYAVMHDKTPERHHQRCHESDSSFEDNFSPQVVC